MKDGKHFINGKWVEGKNFFTTINPSTGEPFGKLQNGRKKEVNEAVKAARNAFKDWSKKSPKERASYITKAADLLVKKYGKERELTGLKTLIMEEMGKRLPEADVEVIESSDILRYFADKGPLLLKPREISLNKDLWPTKSSKVFFQPFGVIGIIKPWNYPLEMPMWALGPALVAGNTVILKPSEYASFVGLEIGKMFEEVGLPEGVLNIITGDSETGKLLVRHSDIDMISFTGSLEAGKDIAVECAKRLRKYNLELGGNDAAIIEKDADLELTANGIVWGSFCNSGQVCVRPKRVFVNESKYEEFLGLLKEKTERLRKDVDFGPIVSKKQLFKIEEFINDAIRKGAKCIVGGKIISDTNGFYFPPTILVNINPNMKIMKEECFVPVLPLTVVKNTHEAIKLANESIYGLGASIWSKDLIRSEENAKSLQTGMVWINDVNVAFPEAPWPSIKQSGGGIDLSEWSLYDYTIKKHINIELSNDKNRAWWFPY